MTDSDFDLGGATINEIEMARTATAYQVGETGNAETMLRENIDDMQQTLNTNLTVFFENQEFDISDLVGMDADEDGSPMVLIDADEVEGTM